MAFLNPSPVMPLPAVMYLVVRYLAAAPKQRDRQDRVQALLAPADVSAESLDASIGAGVAVGLFERDGDELQLPGRLRPAAASQAMFTIELRRLCMAPAHATGTIGSDTGARDLARALTWFLKQDAYGEPFSWNAKERAASVEVLEARQVGVGKIFVNDVRWVPFVRWARALGFGRSDGAGFVPDPTSAIEAALPHVASSLQGDRVDAPRFLEALASELPVLQLGATRSEVDAIARAAPSDPAFVDSTLTHALVRLRSRGVLALELQADAGPLQRMLALPAGAVEAFSSIRLAPS